MGNTGNRAQFTTTDLDPAANLGFLPVHESGDAQARMHDALQDAMQRVSRLCEPGLSERERSDSALRARASLCELEFMIGEVVDRGLRHAWHAGRVAAVFAEVRAAIGSQLLERGLGLRVQDDSDDAMIVGTSALAAGTLSALVGIAASSLSGGDELDISARIEHEMLVFTVSSQGSRAQGRGFRVGVAPLQSGAGFMLAAARRFAQLHGGTLSIPPAPGCGAEFRLELPRLRRPQCACDLRMAA